MITGKNLIGYTLSANSDKTFAGQGGSVKEISSVVFHEAGFNEIHQAVSKADIAFSTYRNFSAEKKIAFFENIALQLAASKDSIIKVTNQETHLPVNRLEGEMQRTINQVKLFANLLREGSWVNAIIDTAIPERTPLPKPDIRQMQMPIGVVGVFGASNFPFAFSVAGGDTISALAAGCTVVYKAHPGHPATSELVGKIINDAAKETGMPDGIFSMLQGASHESGIHLVEHPLIKAIAFTGSFAGGKALYNVASKRNEPIPVYAEMGSINPVFILPGILRQDSLAVADKLAASNTLSAGQFCTNPGVIVSLQSDDTNNFLSRFASDISNASAEYMLTDKIWKGYHAGIKKISATGDIEIMTANKEKENAATPFMFKTPASVFLKNDDLLEEVFGPSSVHVIAGNKNDLVAIAEKLPGQLTISVWGTEDDLINYRDLLKILELKAGRVICNGVPTGVEVTHAMVHGGPYPATTDSRTTSVGTNAIYRFTRAVCYQGFPQNLLPEALQNKNPLKIWRKVNGEFTHEAIN
jgi:NADP-dependent aldehyde dehydrogenase